MIHKKVLVVGGILILLLFIRFFLESLVQKKEGVSSQNTQIISGSFDKTKLKSDEEWKKVLTLEQYHILREQGTEAPFTGKLLHTTEKGTYVSVGCNEPVFRSEAKYDSKTGWPSFSKPISPDAVVLKKDSSIPGEERIEVLDTCGGHLGHVFNDGPPPTGKRYCMNSLALRFVPDKKE